MAESKKYEEFFNRGNDCDTCEHQYMTGRDGTVSACRMADFDRECEYKEIDMRICPCCGEEVARRDMDFTRDCHGITFRLVCFKCYQELMAKGYDGEYYDERDEQIEDDY